MLRRFQQPPQRPRTDEVTLSLLKRAKENGFSALVVTLDTPVGGWRPLDLQTSYSPFQHGLGMQVGSSDPVFMARYNLQPRLDEHMEFPYDPVKLNKLLDEGDEKTKTDSFLGSQWLKETNSGLFRSWEDVKLLRDNWTGPLILKGIQCAQVSAKTFHHLLLTYHNNRMQRRHLISGLME